MVDPQSAQRLADATKFAKSCLALFRPTNHAGNTIQRLRPRPAARLDEGENGRDGPRPKLRASREGAGLIAPPRPEQVSHPARAQAIQLVHGPQNRELLGLIANAAGGEETIQQLAVIDLENTVALRQARCLIAFQSHGDDLGVGFGTVRPHGVGVALKELTISSGPRFLVSPYGSEGVTAEGLGETFPIFSHIAGQRGGQVIAQRHPLFIIVAQGEDTLIGAVRVGQELAQSVGIFEGAGVEGLEAIGLIDTRHRLQDAPLDAQGAATAVLEPARRARERPLRLLRQGLFGHGRGRLARAGAGGKATGKPMRGRGLRRGLGGRL